MRTTWTSLFIVSLVACGPSSRHGGGDDGIDANNMGSGSGSGSGSGNQDGCSDAAKLIYVVDQNTELSQFNPQTKMFHDIGKLACTPIGMPFSMGVDRDANAYVLYNGGHIFKVDTMTLHCTPTTWASSNGLMQFGMGFSTETAGGTTDTLFVAGGTSPMQTSSKLAKLDVGSMTASPLGTIAGWPELTGNGNAELWGFFPDASHPRVEQINKQTGAAIKTFPEDSLALGMPTAWAFAFYGGDYWVFLATDNGTTTVYQVDGTNGSIKGNTPTNRTIVGAGVSTCAPVVIF